MDISAYNRRAWDQLVESHYRWTVPVSSDQIQRARNGDWQVVTKRYKEGWAAEFAIPFATIGGKPGVGKTMTFDVRRHRRNVRQEESNWAHFENGAGLITFN